MPDPYRPYEPPPPTVPPYVGGRAWPGPPGPPRPPGAPGPPPPSRPLPPGADRGPTPAVPPPWPPAQPMPPGLPSAPSSPGPGTGRSLFTGLAVVAAVLALVIGAVALTGGDRSVITGHGTLDEAPRFPAQPTPGNSGSNGGGNSGNSGNNGGGTTRPAPGQTAPASDTQQVGVVTIVSTLRYQGARSAGTGMVVSPDGDILTNNHVIRGSTDITVTVESTGRAYDARVVGTAPGSDVAVIRLQDASGLATAKLADDASDVMVGDRIVGVGNAGGTGRLTAAGGRVTGLDRSITASDGNGQDAEKLQGLIQVNARIISGDSGGPLYDARGEIVGINTAASSNRRDSPTAFAIPIDDAMAIRAKIGTGVETTSIHIGYPGFLGVQTRAASGRGAAVAGLLDGGPAADAGITSGCVITAVDGKPVTSPKQLQQILALRDPGSQVRIEWTDRDGKPRRATVTLGTGPAD